MNDIIMQSVIATHRKGELDLQTTCILAATY